MSQGEENTRSPQLDEHTPSRSRNLRKAASRLTGVSGFFSRKLRTEEEHAFVEHPVVQKMHRARTADAIADGASLGVSESTTLALVDAPPGLLGLYLCCCEWGEERRQGHMITELKASSPLRGRLQPGDQIAKVDGVDSLTFDAEQLFAFLASRAARRRELAVLPSRGMTA